MGRNRTSFFQALCLLAIALHSFATPAGGPAWVGTASAASGATSSFLVPSRTACLTRTVSELESARGDPLAARRERLAYGFWNARKNLRRSIREARWTDHGMKHHRARSEAQARELSRTAAQFLPAFSGRASLETWALKSAEGHLVVHEGASVWKFVRSDGVIGFDQGKPTHWLRVEVSSGFYHGHPMSLERVRKYLPDARE